MGNRNHNEMIKPRIENMIYPSQIIGGNIPQLAINSSHWEECGIPHNAVHATSLRACGIQEAILVKRQKQTQHPRSSPQRVAGWELNHGPARRGQRGVVRCYGEQQQQRKEGKLKQA